MTADGTGRDRWRLGPGTRWLDGTTLAGGTPYRVITLTARGAGVVRELEFRAEAEVTLLTERRRFRPYGLAGGEPGMAGRDWLLHRGRRRRLPGKATLRVEIGDRLRVETPGGGGFGRTRRLGRGVRRPGAS